MSEKKEYGPFIARRIIEIIEKVLLKKSICLIAISGGTTPHLVLKELRKKYYSDYLDWSRVHLFFTDERSVSKKHKDNNYNDCFNRWLKYNERICSYRFKSWINSKDAIQQYEDQIKSVFKLNGGISKFDLIFMGFGEDGHIASLFPCYNFNQTNNRNLDYVYVKSKKTYRYTMTLKILNSVNYRIIGVIGERKKSIVDNLQHSNFHNYPISNLLKSNSKDLWVIC